MNRTRPREQRKIVTDRISFLKNMDEFSEMNAEYAKWFGDPPPARAAIGVARLPRDVDIEIEAIVLL